MRKQWYSYVAVLTVPNKVARNLETVSFKGNEQFFIQLKNAGDLPANVLPVVIYGTRAMAGKKLPQQVFTVFRRCLEDRKADINLFRRWFRSVRTSCYQHSDQPS